MFACPGLKQAVCEGIGPPHLRRKGPAWEYLKMLEFFKVLCISVIAWLTFPEDGRRKVSVWGFARRQLTF